LARRRASPNHANVLSTTHLLGITWNARFGQDEATIDVVRDETTGDMTAAVKVFNCEKVFEIVKILTASLIAGIAGTTRRHGPFSGFWRLGIQQRRAWHFHLLLFVPPSFGSVVELRDFVASSWYEICGELSEGHLQAGTHVEEVRKWSRATSYMGKYVAKPERFPEGVETGRVWGVWSEDLLPVRWETVKVSVKDAYRIRRIYRRLAKIRGRGHLHRLTVFVRHENVVRLLESLGYRVE
jgi:hypothetical protein